MFKNKTTLYLLFSLVIIIWGLIIHKVLGAFGDETVAPAVSLPKITEEVKAIEKDTFSLLPIDRDPFLGHYYKKAIKPKPKSTASVEAVAWPEISYFGLISDSGRSSGIHILQVNGKQFLVEKEGVAEGIKIAGSASGQVTLLYQGHKRTFLKEDGS